MTKHKQNIHAAPKASAIDDIAHILRKKQKALTTGFIGLLVVAIGLLSFSYVREQHISDAQKAFGVALTERSGNQEEYISALLQLVQDYDGTVYASYSAYLAGQQYLSTGDYTTAIQQFDNALTGKQPAGFLLAQTYESKGIALEALNNDSEALVAYGKVLDISEGSHRHSPVRLKMALLNMAMGENTIAEALFREISTESNGNEETIRIAKNNLASLTASK